MKPGDKFPVSIVGQLRLVASCAPGEPDGWTRLNDDCRRMLREAADEIERLRDIIRRRLECDGSNGTYDAVKNLELTTEMYDATRRI